MGTDPTGMAEQKSDARQRFEADSGLYAIHHWGDDNPGDSDVSTTGDTPGDDAAAVVNTGIEAVQHEVITEAKQVGPQLKDGVVKAVKALPSKANKVASGVLEVSSKTAVVLTVAGVVLVMAPEELTLAGVGGVADFGFECLASAQFVNGISASAALTKALTDPTPENIKGAKIAVGFAMIDTALKVAIPYAPVERAFSQVLKRQTAMLEFVGSIVVSDKTNEKKNK